MTEANNLPKPTEGEWVVTTMPLEEQNEEGKTVRYTPGETIPVAFTWQPAALKHYLKTMRIAFRPFPKDMAAVKKDLAKAKRELKTEQANLKKTAAELSRAKDELNRVVSAARGFGLFADMMRPEIGGLGTQEAAVGYFESMLEQVGVDLRQELTRILDQEPDQTVVED